MGMPTKINNQYGFANVELNGGKGSGNFGHSGRPGQIGGSGDGRGSSSGGKTGSKVDSFQKELDAARLRLEEAQVQYDEALSDDEDNTEYIDMCRAELRDAEWSVANWEYKLSEAKKVDAKSKEVSLKDVEKVLQPAYSEYTREVIDVNYNPDKDRYEADVVAHFKDKTPDEKEFWWTDPGKDPKERMSWFMDTSPTYWEELGERIDRAHGGGS